MEGSSQEIRGVENKTNHCHLTDGIMPNLTQLTILIPLGTTGVGKKILRLALLLLKNMCQIGLKIY